MRSKSITELRKDLPALLKSPEKITVTRHGKPVAVVLSHAEFEDLMIAWDLAKDPQRLQDILAEHEDFMHADHEAAPPEDANVEDLARRVVRLEMLYRVAAKRSESSPPAIAPPETEMAFDFGEEAAAVSERASDAVAEEAAEDVEEVEQDLEIGNDAPW